MKDHIKEERQVSVGEGEDVETTIRMLEEAAEGLVSARFDIEVLNGSMWNFAERVVTGWRPMTEVEIKKAEKRREQERRARHKREAAKQEREYAEYLKLKEKYEDD